MEPGQPRLPAHTCGAATRLQVQRGREDVGIPDRLQELPARGCSAHGCSRIAGKGLAGASTGGWTEAGSYRWVNLAKWENQCEPISTSIRRNVTV